MATVMGLTGGIGSGKSTVAQMLKELGAIVIDADAVSRTLTATGGGAIEQLRQAFGEQVLDETGALNRAKMRELMLANPKARTQLEAITHPLIQSEMLDQLQQARSALPNAFIVLDIPLLAEPKSFATWRPRLDVICVVDCRESTQLTRVMARSALSEQQVRALIALQASRAARLAIADFVIDNEAVSLESLRQSVQELFLKLG